MAEARAAILGLAGPVLTAREAAFLRDCDPWGLILFSRNVETPGQVRRLVGEAREALGRAAPVLIDQEGGRVARLSPPHWRAWPPAAGEGDEALGLRFRLIAAELAALGIDANCMPILDVPGAGAHAIIADRALGRTAGAVARRGRIVAEALIAGGVLPVIKHLPGHGRATADSHAALPEVTAGRDALAGTDFAPFRALADAPLGMTAHVRYAALDPERCATLSRTVVGTIRREIGFDGLLMTDDLSMGALEGTMAARVRGSLAAGCDVVLHCNGDMDEMAAVAAEAHPLAGEAARRARAAEAARCAPGPFDAAEAEARYRALSGEAA